MTKLQQNVIGVTSNLWRKCLSVYVRTLLLIVTRDWEGGILLHAVPAGPTAIVDFNSTIYVRL